MKQCAWCKAIYNIHTKKYDIVGAVIMPDATHGICPECKEKAQKELEKLKQKRGQAA